MYMVCINYGRIYITSRVMYYLNTASVLAKMAKKIVATF